MSGLEGLGLEFDESMSGWLGVGAADPVEGGVQGESANTPLRVDAKITIPDLASFMNFTDHTARLSGTVTYGPLGGEFPINNGLFKLFSVDRVTGIRQMVYEFQFTAADGKTYCFYGHKDVKDDPGFDVPADMTTLFTTIHEGPTGCSPVYGAGLIFFHLKDAPAFMLSMRVTGDAWLGRQIAAKAAFISFVYGALRGEYLRRVDPLYHTEYLNLVLSGRARVSDGTTSPFFFVSGAHERDFPWGDGEVFWDFLLVIGDQSAGYRRFCMSDRVIDGMSINVAKGEYHYRGKVFELKNGYSTAFSDMRGGTPGLIPCEAEVDISFDTKQYATSPMPFPIDSDLPAHAFTSVAKTLRSILPSQQLLGVHIIPHTVTVKTGTIKISRPDGVTVMTVDPHTSFGEAESSTLTNVKEPTMLYGYICGVRPEDKTARVQIHADSLRNDRPYWAKDQLDRFLGLLVARWTAKDMRMDGAKPPEEGLQVTDLSAENAHDRFGTPWFRKVGEPLLEVRNDHFPTAVFMRRIIRVRDPDGPECLALEEAMDFMRLERENSTKKVVVAAFTGEDKTDTLHRVLKETDLEGVLRKALKNSGKTRDRFSIVVKPSFMFAYNKDDHSTYTDPQLVELLVQWLRDPARGYSRIAVVEAQSTYGQYFTNRDVEYVAKYLGFKTDGSAGYELVDLTLDEHEYLNLGPHLGNHPVPLTWKNADFRISFAKNKTHCYAFYTLTLKNIYGALPLADKFREYHCKRDIYYTTIEYLERYPVQFGLIDAWLSADGPFGIFADGAPNPTKTIIGGADLVAVDWVAATKMGVDPKISRHMDLAVNAFGKPEIVLKGDSSMYRPWLNVPMTLSLFTHFGLDANHYFGNLVYMMGSYMDETAFKFKDKSAFMTAARSILKPLKLAAFVQAGGRVTVANRLLSRFLTWLGG